MFNKDMLEIIGDVLEELQDWRNYEADMGMNPYDETAPTEADIADMEALF